MEVVETLSQALEEAYKTKDINDMICKFRSYTKYCDKAGELLKESEEKTPIAVKTLRKGLPIIDKKIKEILREIGETAKAVCKKTKDTEYEELGNQTYQQVKGLDKIGDLEKLESRLNGVAYSLDLFINSLDVDESKKNRCLYLIKKMLDASCSDKAEIILEILKCISPHIRVQKTYIYHVHGKNSQIVIDSKNVIQRKN